MTVTTARSARPGAGSTSAVAELASAALAARAPCTSGDPAWTSPRSTAAQIAEACRRCRSCPVVELCREVAAEVRPSFGVWGGTRYGER